MDLLILVILFVWGTLFGSFLNVLIDRFSTERSIVKGRSYCENCKKTLSWKELLPLVSFIIQKGKCIHCKAKIPPRLFLVELLTGLMFPVVYFYGIGAGLPTFQIVSVGVVVYAFLGIFFADLTYGIIPDKLLILSFLGIFGLVGLPSTNWWEHLFSGIASFAFFFFLFAVTKGRGMGFGDVKFAFVLGFFLGYPLTIVALYIAVLTGALISIILVLWKKVSFQKGTVPFGPFLIFGTLLAFFLGQNILPLVSFYLP